MKGPRNRAFTLTELLVVVALAAIGTLILAPALAKTKPSGKAIQCLNNLRQFTDAWRMYAADNNDRLTDNYTSVNFNALDSWANNVMTWGAGADDYDRSNTNELWLANGPLGNYLAHTVKVFKCPADNYLSAAQVMAGFTKRTRSVSMSSLLGHISRSGDSTWQNPPVNPFLSSPAYLQYVREPNVPKPVKTWLVIDEDPDSINDGIFINDPRLNAWVDIPASYHNGGCGISFVDGHSEIRRWRSPTSMHRVQYFYPNPRIFDALGRADFAWYLERTGYVNASTGQAGFGY